MAAAAALALLLLRAAGAQPTRQVLYSAPTFKVRNTANITYAQGLKCTSGLYPGTGCTPMDLLLDVYEPVGDGSGLHPVPARKPAYILSHGGANVGGAKEQYCFQGSAGFMASRGMVAFNIDYRLKGDNGLLPPGPSPDARQGLSADDGSGWAPHWGSGYPAVRDLKAAIRFVRANADRFGVDPSRTVVSGGSAGATNSVAAGVTFDGDYNKELTVQQDPTRTTTHQEFNSSVQAVVAHWSTDEEAYLVQTYDRQNRSRFTAATAPIIEFHGSIDPTINISHARDTQAQYARTGVPYVLHVLEGCAHGAWCYNGEKAPNGTAVCACSNGVAGYDPTMDIMVRSSAS